jgi:hypothetical protein
MPTPSPRRTPHANFAGTWTEDKSGQTNPTHWYLIWEIKQTDTEITISSMTMDPEKPEQTKPPEVRTFNLTGEELSTKDNSVAEVSVTDVRSASWHSDGKVLELLTRSTLIMSNQRLGRELQERLQIDGGVLTVTTHFESAEMIPRDTTAVFRRHINRP